MTRTARQEVILEIVRERPIANQTQLVRALDQRGIQATQTTVSRDLRQLGLVKAADPDGGPGQRYVEPHLGSSPVAPGARSGAENPPLRSAFRQWVRSVEPTGALLVVRTPPGHANAVAIAIDQARLPEISGTLAGDDTILVMVRSAEEEPALRGRLQDLLDG